MFMVEIGRRLQPFMTDPGPVKMIELCEQCADGFITEGELAEVSCGCQPSRLGTGVEHKANTVYRSVPDRYRMKADTMYNAVEAFARVAAVAAG